ncbi:hypothetical protein N7540_010809 [Penicillium herquei]|nr:hypothetical protein N7540_010809 [Penicillium herquei]
MGGIPWSSKACKNCKAGKVKVGTILYQENHPTNHLISVTYKNLNVDGALKEVLIAQGMREDVLSSRHVASKQAVTRIQPTKMFQSISSGPAKLVQISSTYINLWFPMETPQISGIDMWFGKDSWFQIFTHIQQIPNKSPMLERAIIAISMVCLGKLNHDEVLVEQGIRWYNSSIRHLLHMIQRNDLSQDMIFATVIFQMLEVWYSPYGMGAFVAHINGTNTCIKRLTDAQASTPVMKILTRDQRRLSIMALPLADDMKYVAQAGQPSEDETPIDELYNLLAPVSNLVFESNKIESSDWQAANRILSATLGCREEILSWYARRKDSVGLPFHSSSKSLATEQNQKSSRHLFGTPYSFLSFESAALHVIYWNALILVEELIHTTHTNVSLWSGEKPTDYTEQSIGHEMSEFYADEICRSVPYCLSGASGGWGVGALIGCLSQIVRPYIALRRKEKVRFLSRALPTFYKSWHGTSDSYFRPYPGNVGKL